MSMAPPGEQCEINGCRRQKTSWLDIRGDFVEVCDWHVEKLAEKPNRVANIPDWMKSRSLSKRRS